jgi:type IV pilus assembly protein PilB
MDFEAALAKFLVTQGIISEIPPGELGVKKPQEGLIKRLSDRNLLNEQQALSVLSKELRIPLLDPQDPEVSAKLATPEFADRVKPETCWEYHIVPLWEDGASATVAVTNPFNQEALQSLQFMLSKRIDPVLVQEVKLVRLLAHFFPQGNTQHETSEGGEQLEILPTNVLEENLDAGDHDAPAIVRLVNRILIDAINMGASDIHLEPAPGGMSVRFRVDGVLQEIIKVPAKLQGNIVARLKVLGGMNIAERRRPQDGRLRVRYAGQGIDIRSSTIPTSYGEKAVLRVLRGDYRSLNFESLGMPVPVADRISVALQKKGKLFLVCGPTGAGKTTTLYVALNKVQDGKTNIVTIEDPIEYRFPNINQIQVNNRADITFASVLRSVFRQDPDVIMVGEIRDSETLSTTLQAAQTGHLVLSTVHTNDAPSAISRLCNLGGDLTLLSTCLIGILAQRLVRKVCDKCAKRLTAEELATHAKLVTTYSLDPRKLRIGRGCEACFYSGYKGRIGIYSYLEITDRISDAIFRKLSQEEIIRLAKDEGFKDLEEQALSLLSQGITTISEIRSYLENIDAPKSRSFAELENRTDLEGETGAGTGIRKRKVLIVDDNASVRKMVSTLLRKEMVDVVEASGSLEALEMIYQSPPQLIVCDISMPEMDGTEFLKKLKRDKATRDLPVIMLTADDSPEKELELLELGASEFLSKRASPPIMVGRIRSALERLQ